MTYVSALCRVHSRPAYIRLPLRLPICECSLLLPCLQEALWFLYTVRTLCSCLLRLCFVAFSNVCNAMTFYACPAACLIWLLALAFPVGLAASLHPHHCVFVKSMLPHRPF